MAPITIWGLINAAEGRPSLHLYVDSRREVSAHWTPLPEWLHRAAAFLTLRKRRVPTLPRGAAISQVPQWIALAHANGFERVTMESPLFVARCGDGQNENRSALDSFVSALAALPQVAQIYIDQPAPLARGRALAFGHFWPNAAGRAPQDPAGRMMAARVMIDLVVGEGEPRTADAQTQ